ncbi:MAG: FAD-dependent protein [Chitinophagaceae bacterium]
MIEFKAFALGVRIEHPQPLIDSIQYHTTQRDAFLPPASYSLVQQVNGRGVFSFCMCPGGIIAPAATGPGELVVNGWSPSKRNNPFANSGMVVPVEERDLFQLSHPADPRAGLFFQQSVEHKAYAAGGGRMVAPAQRMVDMVNNKVSTTLPDCSYLPGIRSASIREVLPDFIFNSLKISLKEFDKKRKGYFTNEAVVVATESRTSSPVRIPRNNDNLQHPQVANLYPCSEGAGYAGGIVSAAMDGENVAEAISRQLSAAH